MSEALTKALAEHGDAIKSFREETSEKLEKVGELGERLNAVEQAVSKGLKNVDFAQAGPHLDASSLREDADHIKAIQAGQKGAARQYHLGAIGVKAMVNFSSDVDSNDSTYPTRPDNLGLRLGQALRPLRLLDVLPARPVTSNSIEYVQLKWTGDADYQLEEGDEKAEMDFEGTLLTAPIATIAVHTTTSAQVLDDVDQLRAKIEQVMNHKVLDRVEINLITGSGIGNRIHGLYHQATFIQTGQSGIAERIGKAITTMENEGYSVNVILMNPNDWFELSMIKDGDGNYIYGNPASPAAPTLWNRPVITSPSIPENTALVGNTAELNVLDRMQPTVFISRDHKDYRTKNLVLLLVEVRVGLELYDNKAFRKVDLEGSESG